MGENIIINVQSVRRNKNKRLKIESEIRRKEIRRNKNVHANGMKCLKERFGYQKSVIPLY